MYEREREPFVLLYFQIAEREREKERDALMSTGLSVDVNVTWAE